MLASGVAGLKLAKLFTKASVVVNETGITASVATVATLVSDEPATATATSTAPTDPTTLTAPTPAATTAASNASSSSASSSSTPPKQFVAKRSFYFLLEHTDTGAIVFSGQVVNAATV
jgi:serine protease inhibitor